MKLTQQTKLFFKEGKSDKVYEIDLCELSENEYLVNFRYGRRGAALKEGTKTPRAVTRDAAEKLFAGLEHEKRKKGYQTEIEVGIKLPDPAVVNPGTKEGVILQRLQDAIEGKNSFKTIWKTSRVIWKAAELQMQEAIPFIIKLVNKGDELQTYAALYALLSLRAENAQPVFQSYAFQQKQKTYIRHIAVEGLLSILEGEEVEKIKEELLRKLPENLQENIRNQESDKVKTILRNDSEKGSIAYFTTLYQLSKLFPEIQSHIREAVKSWPFRPPYFKHIRAIYKLAQIRKDLAMLAILSYRFEKESPMFRRTIDLESNYSQYIPDLNKYIKIGQELRSRESKIAFSHFTKTYFQKNALNYLKNAGKDKQEYLKLAMAILLQYSEADYTPEGERPDSEYGTYNYRERLYYFTLTNYPECSQALLLTHILFGNDPLRKLRSNLTYMYSQRTVVSERYYYHPQMVRPAGQNSPGETQSKKNSSVLNAFKNIFSGKKNVDEQLGNPVSSESSVTEESVGIRRMELYPEYWDKVPEAYIQLLMQAKMNIIHRFAYHNLTAHPRYEDLSGRFDSKILLALLDSGFEYPGKLALDTLQRREKEFISDPAFMGEILNSTNEQGRNWARQVIDRNTRFYMADMDFMMALLFNCREENVEWINTLLKHANLPEDRSQALLGKVVAKLLEMENTAENYTFGVHTVNRLNSIAYPHMEKVSWEVVEQLIASPLLSNVFLASIITTRKAEKTRPEDIPLSLMDLYLQNDIPEVRKNGFVLMDQYPPDFLVKHIDFVVKQVNSPYKDVVTGALNSIRKLLEKDTAVGNSIIQRFAYTLIRKESFEGSHLLIRGFMANELKAFRNTGLEPKDITRLIHSQYRESQLAGYEMLTEYIRTAEFSLGQIISFGSHELLAVRQWCWRYFKENVSRIRYEKQKALNLLDVKWDDTREYAFQFFRTEFTEADWDAETLVGIVDSIRPDVERFGKELITRYFNPENAMEYITKLSQHPSIHVQAFVTGYLSLYASGKPDVIREMDFYFRSVLMRVNKGRVAKDRVLDFLRQEALKDPEVAAAIVPILDTLSAQETIQDKETCIDILREIKVAYPHLDMCLMIKN